MTKKYLNIEFLRVLSAISIVYFHSMPLDNEFRKYGYIGLVIFLLISNILPVLNKNSNLTFLQYIRKKNSRIILPFIVWSVFYFFLSVYLEGFSQTINKFSIISIFSGTFYHLWYLPYIYFTYIFIYLIRRKSWGENIFNLRVIYLLLISLFVFLGQSLIIYYFDLTSPFIQWITSFPCLFLSLCVGKSLNDSHIYIKTVPVVIPVSVAIVGILALTQMRLNPQSQTYFLSYSIGFFIFCWSFSMKIFSLKAIKIIQFFSNLTLGVYLIHPFVILLVMKFYSTNTPEILFLLTVIISFLMSYTLKQIPVIKNFV